MKKLFEANSKQPVKPSEPPAGFEPATCSLRMSCSTAELRRRLPPQRYKNFQSFVKPVPVFFGSMSMKSYHSF